jgi:transcriptional regulator with XRE-family HTH domain
MSTIRDRRLRAGLTAAEVASAVGRNATWLGLVEAGATPLAPEHEKLILTAIGRLERFAETVASAREKLVADLKLPPAPPTRGRPHPGGSHAP